ncbi:sensor histidine kinase [Balneola vulgaris]|uniref:sensor histidine kinase n=1 Tax=Balneola vulgaris TaxID=287535 RepID=UPI00036786BE|nr:ATP-binding protein [Balneola vulgaris]
MVSSILLSSILELFTNNYMPHGACYFWEPGVLWANVIGDGITAFSYFMIPGLLVYFVNQRKDLEMKGLFVAFAVFIIACGTVHLIAILNVWVPYYNIAGILKMIMAIVSIATVFLLYKSVPEMLQIPSPASLKAANDEIVELNENLEDKVRQRTSALNEMNKELESFSYSISHDLQIPIRAILGYSSLLKEESAGKLNEDEFRKLETISKSALKMNELIQGILEFSRLGRRDLIKKPVDMREIFQDSYDELIAAMNVERDIQFNLKDIPKAYGDELLLKQVISNIIGNAIKYAGDANPIEIDVYAEETDADITYYVKDNGIGFDERYKHKMFEVFQRLHDDNVADGTGVGLAIVHRIILKHYGTLDATSDGDGSTFFFSLPK